MFVYRLSQNKAYNTPSTINVITLILVERKVEVTATEAKAELTNRKLFYDCVCMGLFQCRHFLHAEYADNIGLRVHTYTTLAK